MVTWPRRALAASGALMLDRLAGEPPVPGKLHPVALFGSGVAALEDAQRLAERVRSLLGASVRVTVDPVSEIPPESSGKYRYVISKVADQHVGDLLAGAANAPGPR